MEALAFDTVEETVHYVQENHEKGFILHVPIAWIHDLAGRIPSDVILSSTSGEYTCDGYKDKIISGFSYDKNIVQIVEIQNPPITSVDALKSAYDKVKNNTNAFMLLLLDGLSAKEETVMTTLFFMDKNFKIIGGSTGDELAFKETVLYIGSKRVEHLAVFFDMKSRTQLLKENIYVPTEKKFLITEADPINRRVISIDNRPASLVYAEALGISEGQLGDYFMNNPLGKEYKEEVFIASPMKVNPDHSITFYCQIMPNTFVYLLKAIDPLEKLDETLSQLAFRPRFLYVVNCILRSLKFQQENQWKSFDNQLLKVCRNTTGFVSYGEQFYKYHVNQTMVILAIE